VAFSDLLGAKPTRVKVLDEELVLFRDADGRVAALELRCAHRGVALDYGRVEGECIRCPYHGWLYDRSGQCVEQPAEPAESSFKDRIRLRSYPMQERAGLVFAYLGPQPAPLLPNYDLLCREDGVRTLWGFMDHCNWVQSAENSIDQAHLAWLHTTQYPQWAAKKMEIHWDRTSYGVRAVTEFDGIPDPKVSCTIFPSYNRFTSARSNDVGNHRAAGPRHNLLFRVPIDDTHLMNMFIMFTPTEEGVLVQHTDGYKPTAAGEFDRADDDGWWGIDTDDQDRMVLEAQGAIADRGREHLGASDRGIILWRNILRESIEAVAEGRDPFGVVRDPAANVVVSFEASMAELTALV